MNLLCGGASNFLGELGGRDMIGSGFIYDLEFKETSYVGEFSYSLLLQICNKNQFSCW